jgi:hypothetical protein
MNTEQLFYASILDAVNVVVLALGGPKKVGERLWPALKSSGQRVTDCLNPNRDEKFSLDELVKIARWGRDIGCHAIAPHFNAEAGYTPPVPLAPADEKAELDRKIIETVGTMRHLVERAEAIYGRK